MTFARVNYATHRARVRFDPAVTGLAAVLGRIRSAGYLPKPYGETEGQAAQRRETRDLLVRLGTAGFLSSQLMVITIALYAGYFQGIDPGTRRLLEWVGLGLTLPVYFYSGAPFLRNTVTSLRHGRFNMDALIALGAGAALAYSVWQMLAGGEVYLDTAAMIVTLVLVGRYVEAAAKGRASEAVARLAALQPREARRIEPLPGGGVSRCAGSRWRSFAPATGSRWCPASGSRPTALVRDGRSEVDESLVTGESRPVGKEPGSPGHRRHGEPARILRPGGDPHRRGHRAGRRSSGRWRRPRPRGRASRRWPTGWWGSSCRPSWCSPWRRRPGTCSAAPRRPSPS